MVEQGGALAPSVVETPAPPLVERRRDRQPPVVEQGGALAPSVVETPAPPLVERRRDPEPPVVEQGGALAPSVVETPAPDERPHARHCGSRPMKPISFVCASASAATSTRGPYCPLERSISSIGSMPASIWAQVSASSVSS